MYYDVSRKLRYEAGDMLLERDALTKRFVLIVTTNKIPQMRWGATRYFLFDESYPHGVIYDATKEDLKVLFKPYVEDTAFYK